MIAEKVFDLLFNFVQRSAQKRFTDCDLCAFIKEIILLTHAFAEKRSLLFCGGQGVHIIAINILLIKGLLGIGNLVGGEYMTNPPLLL